MKIDGWERLLEAEIEASRTREFAFGSYDCARWAATVAARLRGEPDPKWPDYGSSRDAFRALREAGYRSLPEAGRAVLGEPLKNVLLAQRGDIVLGRAFGICIGADTVHPDHIGLARLPLGAAKLAWRT